MIPDYCLSTNFLNAFTCTINNTTYLFLSGWMSKKARLFEYNWPTDVWTRSQKSDSLKVSNTFNFVYSSMHAYTFLCLICCLFNFWPFKKAEKSVSEMWDMERLLWPLATAKLPRVHAPLMDEFSVSGSLPPSPADSGVSDVDPSSSSHNSDDENRLHRQRHNLSGEEWRNYFTFLVVVGNSSRRQDVYHLTLIW